MAIPQGVAIRVFGERGPAAHARIRAGGGTRADVGRRHAQRDAAREDQGPVARGFRRVARVRCAAMTHAPVSDATPQSATPWRMLALLAAAELLGMSLWFAANAARIQLGARWGLDAGQLGWLTTAVQLGFVVGTASAAVLNLADLWPARNYFAVSALLASLANLSLLAAPGYGGALVSRFATGCFLAGVYPPGMKMAATWFRERRGLAIGVLVGALGIGKGIPYLVHALGDPDVFYVVTLPSLGAVGAAVMIATLYHDGPYPFERRPFDWKLVADVVRHRETRLATSGYLGHMWELYAMWTWMPAFLAAGFAAAGAAPDRRAADLATFFVLVAGAGGCVWGGWAAGGLGYSRVVTIAMAASGACCLTVGLVFGASPWLLMPLVLVWGFFVVADSAQFSAMVTEYAPRHAVGTALTLQTSVGFLLTTVTIQGLPVLVAHTGWRWAFTVLALGPACGIAAIARLGARPPSTTRAHPAAPSRV